MALPDGERATFARSDPWSFPAGTVFVKHFELALDEREPGRVTRLETRLLVAGSDRAYYGLTYKWNSDGSDAELVTEPLFEELTVVDRNGSPRAQTWFYPAPGDCLTCHNAAAGHVLGVRTAQLNGPQSSDVGRAVNELATWLSRGLLYRPDPDDMNDLPRLSGLRDETRSLEERVRSYWDSNCSMCHGVQDEIRANWDARYETPLEQRGLISRAALNGGEGDSTLLIDPGHPDRSVLYLRNASLSPDQRMPPLASHRRDEVYLDVLERWISSLRP
jgi:hypothetical protein